MGAPLPLPSRFLENLCIPGLMKLYLKPKHVVVVIPINCLQETDAFKVRIVNIWMKSETDENGVE